MMFVTITSFNAGINRSESAGEAPAAEARAASSSSLDRRPPDLSGALAMCRSTPSLLCITSSLPAIEGRLLSITKLHFKRMASQLQYFSMLLL